MLTEKYLKEGDVAAITKMSLPTLRRARCENRGIPYIKIGRLCFYDPSDVQMFMEKHKVRTED